MSTSLRTLNFGVLQNCGFFGPEISIIHIDEYEIPLEEFCDFAAHILGGGLMGWGEEGVPPCVREAVENINERLVTQPKTRPSNPKSLGEEIAEELKKRETP